MGVFHESNSKNFVPGPSQNTVPDSYSEQDIDHQLINTGNVDQGSNDATGDLDHGDTDVTSNNNTNNDNNNDNNSNAAIFVNDNTTKTNSKYNSYPNLINPGTPPISNILVPSNRQSTQIKLYSKMPYRHLKCDACDASDATDATSRKTETNHKAKTKAEEVGLPEIPCIYCNFKDPIAFDLSLHYIEKHRYQLIRLPIGKATIDDRADYAVELSKKRLLESFEDEDKDENEDDDAYEIEEEEDE